MMGHVVNIPFSLQTVREMELREGEKIGSTWAHL